MTVTQGYRPGLKYSAPLGLGTIIVGKKHVIQENRLWRTA
jgi:hypothetical protein